MNHLKLHRKDEYRYQTGETGDIVRVEVEYSKGNSPRTRGVFFRVTPLKIENTEYGHTESFGLFSGASVFVMKLDRSTPKVLAAIAAQIDPLVPELATLFLTDKQAVVNRVKALFSKPEVTA